MKRLKIQIIISLTIILILSNIFSLKSFASFNIESAQLVSKGDCGRLIKRDGAVITITYVVYEKDGKEYPAYCQDKSAPGVGEKGSYTVSVDSLVSNVRVWRAAINGYPYKQPSELGCDNAKQAYAATKMAIYSVLYGYTTANFSGIGTEGDNVVNAIDQILKAVDKGENKISSDLNITPDTSVLDKDIINSKYISQTYKVTANAAMQNYTVSLAEQVPEGTLITDVNNNVKSEFSPSEKFKILIPIAQLGNGGNLKINVKSGVKTKPVFYGKGPTGLGYQDYAISGAWYEDGVGQISLNYPKNETKLKIYKKDNESQEVLSGAKFDLYDESKNIMYTNLISNDEGQILINNLLPGTYYLKETKAPIDYQLYEDYIKLDINFNEEISVIINNSKGEKPTVEVTKNKIQVKQQIVQTKLPKTGM